MKTLHILIPTKVYKVGDTYYASRPFFFNELAKRFRVKRYCCIEEKAEIDERKLVAFDERIEFVPLFRDVGIRHFVKNVSFYKQNIKALPRDEFYFTTYPGGMTSMLIAYLLKEQRLAIWVKSDPVAVYNSFHLMFADGFLKGVQRLILNPLKSGLYILFSKIVFKDNLIFYTANATINKKDHTNQHEIISCPVFNRDKSIIKDALTHSVCFVGGEGNLKGLDVLLKALRESPLKDSITLNIIGLDQFTKERNKQLAEGLSVTFHGAVYERNAFYSLLSQNDILVMPSFAEKQGKVQLEAMSAGVVPICSDSGGTYMTVGNYHNGLLFKPGDHIALREHIRRLYRDEELYATLKKNGLEYVKGLSLEKQIEYMASVIYNFYKL